MKKHAAVQIGLLVATGMLLVYFHHMIPAIVIWSLVIVLVLLALFAPEVHQTASELGLRVEKHIGTAIGTVLLTLTYYSIFWPGAMWLRIARIDVLTRQFPGSAATNWVERTGYNTRQLLYPKQYSRPHGRVRRQDSRQ